MLLVGRSSRAVSFVQREIFNFPSVGLRRPSSSSHNNQIDPPRTRHVLHSLSNETATRKTPARCFQSRCFSESFGLSSFSSLLRQVQDGTLTVSEAEAKLKSLSSAERNKTSLSTKGLTSSFANLDHNRAQRAGFPEVIFAQGKTPEQISLIFDEMAGEINEKVAADQDLGGSGVILATRVDPDLYRRVSEITLQHGVITYHETARIISMTPNVLLSRSNVNAQDKQEADQGKIKAEESVTVVIACAGTTDLPVAEEAAVTLEQSSCCNSSSATPINVERVYDVGVAGLHRIINALPTLQHPNIGCVIVVAGMDGALPSVVGGLVSVPVIAVPTSVGYGACFGGVSALLTMLNACAPGVGVVNIDNGFGAAAMAYKCVASNVRRTIKD